MSKKNINIMSILEGENKEPEKIILTNEKIEELAKKSEELLEASFSITSKTEKRKTLREALELCPQNIDAKIALFNLESKLDVRISSLLKLMDEEKIILEGQKIFKKANIGNFGAIREANYFMKIGKCIGLAYLEGCYYSKSLDMFKYLFDLDNSEKTGYENLIMAIYLKTNDFEELEKFLNKVEDTSYSIIYCRLLILKEKNLPADANIIYKSLDEKYRRFLVGIDKVPKAEYKKMLKLDFTDNMSLQELICFSKYGDPGLERLKGLSEYLFKNYR